MVDRPERRDASILYVDDEPALLELAKAYMERQGHEVYTIGSAEEALEVLERRSFDAILSDFQMPSMDGIEFLSRLRERGDDTPFIIFTGRDREEVVIDALNLGADFYMQKGGEPKAQFAELLNSIDHAIMGRRRKKELERSEERFQKALGLIPDMVSIHDPDMNILYSNWNGYAAVPEERRVINSKCHQTYRGHEDICPDCPAQMVFRTKKPVQMEGVLKDGTYIDLRVIPILDADGEVEMFLEWMRDITSTKMTERRLKEETNRMESLIKGIQAGTWAGHLPDGGMEYNLRYKEMFGHGPDWVGPSAQGLDEMIHPEDLERFKGTMEDHLEGLTDTYHSEYRMRHKDGRWIWIQDMGRVTERDDDGAPLYITGMTLDISDRKADEELLVYEKNVVEAIIDGIEDMLVIQRPDHVIERYNRTAFEALDVGPDDIQGRRCFEMLGRTERCDVCSTEMALATGRPAEVEKFMPETGRYYDIRSSPIRDASGRIIRVVEHLRDITEKKKSEDALRSSEEKYRMLVDHTSDVVWSMDGNGAFSYVSPAVKKISGYELEELVGKDFRDFLHPDDRKALEATIAHMLETGEPVEQVELRFTHPDGEWHWYSVSLTPVFQYDGTYSGIVGVSKNITARVEAEQSMRRANRQLELMTKISRHDILNKSMAANGFLELIDEEPLDETSRSHLGMVRDALSGIVSSVEFTRLYEGIGSSEPKWIGLEDVVRSLQSHGLRIEYDVEGLEVYADMMLDKVFENLLDNSLRHGGNHSWVRIGWKKEGDGATIVWEDDGNGVPPRMKETIFSQGFGSNTGLGLFLTREILSITGMGIRECGVPGEGARFEISIPEGRYRLRTR